MKIAKNHYGRFESDSLGLYLDKGQTFIVTPKILKSKQFQTGLVRKKFEFVEVTDLAIVQNAVNVTDKILENYREMLTTDPEPEEPTPPTTPDQDDPPADEQPPEDDKPPEDEGDKTEEAPPEDADPVLPFTEAAGAIPDALAAIEKETDIEKLKFALENESRVTVLPAIEERLKELEA